MRSIGQLTIILVTLIALTLPARADTIAKIVTLAGMKVNYKVILPNGYDPSRAYPTVLTFGGGSQDMTTVDRGAERFWRDEAERRGYIIVSPAAPAGRLFFQAGERIFPEFLQMILHDYKVQGGKLHIAAFYPQYFWSVTGFPGYLPEDSNSNIDGLKKVCVYMHVGELDDPAWLAIMKQNVAKFQQRGLKVHFTIEKGQPHGIGTLAGENAKRLFDQFEEAAKGCN